MYRIHHYGVSNISEDEPLSTELVLLNITSCHSNCCRNSPVKPAVELSGCTVTADMV